MGFANCWRVSLLRINVGPIQHRTREFSQVLDSLKVGMFTTAGDEDTWGSDVLKIFAIGLAFKVVSPVPLPMHPEAGLS